MNDQQSQDTKPDDRDEWMTPNWVISLACQSFGNFIDLDPCSTAQANENIGALAYFDRERDGLAQDWHGSLFMNPPYSRGNIDLWVDKLIAEYNRGNVYQAFVVTNNSTETKWAAKLFHRSSALCLPYGRVNFLGVDGKVVKGNRQGQAFWYFGDHSRQFREACERFGVVLSRVSSEFAHPLYSRD